MKAEAKLNHLRIAPRKVRLLADMIRRKKADKAEALLSFSIKKGAEPMKKLLLSCKSNAVNNFGLDEATLAISEIKVDEGPKLKRWRARSKGRAMPIQKKTSHITLVLEGKKGGEVKKQEKKQEKVAQKTKGHQRAEKDLGKRVDNKGSKRVFKRKSF